MKNKIFTFAILFVILNSSILIVNCFAQWMIQNSGTTAILNDIQFINENTGYVCGSGTILKTTNKGNNWISLSHPATNKLFDDLYVVDSNTVYCVGFFETILKSTNGGENWIVIKNGPWGEGPSQRSVFFINPNTGWIGGTAYYIYKTTNGGTTFDSTYVFWGYFNDIYFKDSLTGLICADGSGMFKTTNGGLNWVQIQLPNGGVLGSFEKLNVINNQYVWVVGSDNKVYKSIDFGSSWDSIATVLGANECYCSCFSSMNTGWAGGTYGRLFKSTNGGYNWINQNLSTAYQRTIFFINDYTGWTCGGGGRILYTTTGGVTSITNNIGTIPEEFYLEQNFPNPFNSGTIIRYILTKPSKVELSIFDISGKKIRTLVSGYKSAGTYDVIFKADDLTTGIYFYKMTAGDFSQTKKLILLR